MLDGGDIKLHVPVQSEILFACLSQHTKKLGLWKSFDEWRSKGGQYLLNLSTYWGSIKREAEADTGLKFADLTQDSGLLLHFPVYIYESACSHAFFGSRPREYNECEIVSPKLGVYVLQMGPLELARSHTEDEMKHCLSAFQEMMKGHHRPCQRVTELEEAAHIWSDLKKLEEETTYELQRLRLKRTFPGRCDLCPV